MARRPSASAAPPAPEQPDDNDLLVMLDARRKAAQPERDAFQPLLDEAFEYAIPYRKSTAKTGKGEKRVDRLYDQTAVTAAFRFAGKLQQDLVPAGQQFFALEIGPVGSMGAPATSAQAKALKKQLEQVSSVIAALFLGGEWDNAFHEMALDLGAGTGAMLILEGSAAQPARFVSAAIDELLLEGGPYGDITGIFWSRKWTLRAIKEQWPDSDLGDKLERQAKDKPGDEVTLHQDTFWDPKAERWVLVAWIPKGGSDRSNAAGVHVNTARSRTCPWLTPRYFRVAGETMGRGPIMLALPTIKVLNKAQQFTLQAAAIALLGIFTAVDDGVFNPDLAEIAPGAFWKVARNNGALGPSVQRLADPRLDLNQIVLKDLVMQVQATLMDQSLPPDGAAVRSATEIIERVKRLASDHIGAFGRLVREIIVPAVKRVMEIAANKLLIPDAVPIDELLVKVRVISPLAQAREAQRVETILQWLQIVMTTAPLKADEVADIVDALKAVGEALGVPSDYILDDVETTKVQQQKAAQAAIATAAQAAPAIKAAAA
jgi:hypothetical protein